MKDFSNHHIKCWVINEAERVEYEGGAYSIALLQPQCEHLSEAVTGRVGVS